MGSPVVLLSNPILQHPYPRRDWADSGPMARPAQHRYLQIQMSQYRRNERLFPVRKECGVGYQYHAMCATPRAGLPPSCPSAHLTHTPQVSAGALYDIETVATHYNARSLAPELVVLAAAATAPIRRGRALVVRHVRQRVQLEVRARVRDDLRRDVVPVLLRQLALLPPNRRQSRVLAERGEENKRDDALGVVVHDDRHAVHVQAVRLRHHALPEAVRDVVRAQQRRDHDRELRGHDREHRRVPPLEDEPLEHDVRALAPGQQAPRVARLRHRRLDERVEVPAAAQLVLHAQAAVEPEVARPLRVDLALEVERALLVRDVARRDEQREADPEQERVHGEERAVVEQDAGPADEGCEHGERGGDRRDDQLRLVPDADDVGVCPDVEVDEEGRDETRQGVHCELDHRRQ